MISALQRATVIADGKVDGSGEALSAYDPYSFPPCIGELDMHLFGEGRHLHAYRFLGANPWQHAGIEGVLFAVWAPNAERVSVVGDFNDWDGRIHPMRTRGGSGIWEIFIPELEPGSIYKFEIRMQGGSIVVKSDPYGKEFELRPNTGSLVNAPSSHRWQDHAWLTQRASFDWMHRPVSIYEVHLGSWMRDDSNGFLNYRDLAEKLA